MTVTHLLGITRFLIPPKYLFPKFLIILKDFLPLYAAGNSGSTQYRTLGSPGVSKNCISVGAHISAYESHQYLTLLRSIKVLTPSFE